MSCDKCTHCQQAKRNAQIAANAYEPGAELRHSELGLVFYWRADLTLTDIHYVERAGDTSGDLITVSGKNLTRI